MIKIKIKLKQIDVGFEVPTFKGRGKVFEWDTTLPKH